MYFNYPKYSDCINNEFEECKHDQPERYKLYPNLEYARLVNNTVTPGQTGIRVGEPLSFTDLLINKGKIVRFSPNTTNIILEDCSVYFVIYESRVEFTTPANTSALLGLILKLDNISILSSGTTATAVTNQKIELVSHAIITTKENNPNILELINQSDVTINAFGANISIIKLADLKER